MKANLITASLITGLSIFSLSAYADGSVLQKNRWQNQRKRCQQKCKLKKK